MQFKSMIGRTALISALSLSIIACSSDDDTDTAGIDWQPCPDNAALDCASLDAPLIHGSSDERTISIDLKRLPSTGRAPELLMLNPGGPGGSGTDVIDTIDEFIELPESIRERFDIVGFDPRGIGRSERIDCSEFSSDSIDSGYVANAAELQVLVDDTGAYAEACTGKYGDRLAWLGSNQVVQDMELIRMAYGADVLDFIGFSYGTRLAALYLERFPDSSGRIVLDAPVLPDSSLDRLLEGQAAGMQSNLERLFESCGTTVPDCDPVTIEAALQSRIASLMASDDQATIELVGALFLAAVSEPAFGELAAAPLLQYVLTGDTAPLEGLFELLGGLEGGNDEEGLDNLTVQRAVLCADDPARPAYDDVLSTFERLNTLSDSFGEFLTASIAVSCVGWPASLDPVPTIATTAAPVSLVIGGTSDAQTPLEWAPIMADAIGGQLLVSDHSGHTVVLSDESACVEMAVLDFLLDGTLPVTQTCESNTGMVTNE